MTNRLQILERERERLEQALADDPHWQSFCEARKRRPEGVRRSDLSPETLAGLAASSAFAAYIKVARAIDTLRAAENKSPPRDRSSESATTSAPEDPAEEPSDGAQAFRTRVHVKTSQVKPSPVQQPDVEPPQDHSPETTEPSRIDDLTAIRRIDRQLAKQLNELGVFSYNTIADWDRYEVRRVRDALDLGKRIWRENWIEQAALLQLRAPELPTTEPRTIDAVPAKSEAPAPAAQPEQQPAQQAAPAASPSPEAEPVSQPTAEPSPPEPPQATPQPEPVIQVAVPAPQPRKTIKVGHRPQRLPAPAARRFAYLFGVSDITAEGLRSAGVKSLADIAAWSRADVKWYQAILGDDAHISRDQWIEQATLLSRGIWTKHALRVVNGETRLVVAAPKPLQISAPALGDVSPESKDATPITAEPVADAPATPAPEDIEPADAHLLDSSDALPTPTGPAKPEPAAAPPVDNQETERNQPEPAAELMVQQQSTHHAASTEPVATSPPTAPTDRFNPLRGLTTTIALGKIKRPPPDLELRSRRLNKPDGIARPSGPSSLSTTASRASEAKHAVAPEPVRRLPEATPLVIELSSPVSEPAHTDLNDDLDDADALVVKRATPPAATAVDLAPSESVAPKSTLPALPAEDTPPEKVLAPDTAWDDDATDDTTWGDEAQVVIVSRPRSDRSSSDAGADSVEPQVNEPPKAPDFAARHAPAAHSYNDDTYDTRYVGYQETVEEATVTIIRAEASEESAATMVPREIANDADALASDQPTRKPRMRAIGSRFLKALTGD